ncbi:MAG TPA: hypothetical protein VFR31_12875 [Thermoanaerobaculia bacterium]|nr:hypothetical protein [Thermoanaerobaculia bacterium]
MTFRSVLVCLGLLVAVPAFAAGPDPGFGKFLELSGESTQGSCTAQCGDMGGTASVQCQGTCTIQDQDCDSGVRGYVQCHGTSARADCPVCESCSAETPCPEGGSVWCGPVWGYAYDCTGGPGLCFAQCKNQFYFCPGHWGQIIC